MKKFLFTLFVILFILIIICVVGIQVNAKQSNIVKQQNKQYEQYLQNEIYGTDVVTLINKAINSNEENNVLKDEKGLYLNNNQNSIQIDLVMITDEEKNETKIYHMETIAKVGVTEFIKNFNTTKFKCTKIEYHLKTGKIANIELTQQND